MMPTAPVTVHGIVKGGVVVPDATAALPEGTHVTILVGDLATSPELAGEIAAWERASDEAWGLIDDLEKETP
jgi:hypothetical protein